MIIPTTIPLSHKKFPIQKFLMTSLRVICGLPPLNQNSWLRLWVKQLQMRFCQLLRKPANSTANKYLRNPIQNSIFFDAPRPNEVYNIIDSLKCKKSSNGNVIPRRGVLEDVVSLEDTF